MPTMKLDLHDQSAETMSSTDSTHPPPYKAYDNISTSTITISVKVDFATIEYIRENLMDDLALLTLSGIVRTQVGTYIDSHVFLEQTIQTSWANVLATSSITTSNPKTYIAHISFPVTDRCHNAPSSATFQGTTYVTEHTALSDQHLVNGNCDIVYRVIATTSPDIRKPRCSRKPCVLNCTGVVSLPPSRLSIDSTHAIAKAKNSISARSLFKPSTTRLPRPKVTLRVPETHVKLNNTRKGPVAAQQIRVPLEIHITMARSSNAALLQDLLRRAVRDFLSAKAQFVVNRRFGPRTDQQTHTIRHIETHRLPELQHIDVPPFYVSDDGEIISYTSVAELVLEIPSAYTQVSSSDLGILHISYILHIELTMKKLAYDGCALLQSHSCKLWVPCIIA